MQFGAPLVAGTLQEEWDKGHREFVIDGKVYEVSARVHAHLYTHTHTLQEEWDKGHREFVINGKVYEVSTRIHTCTYTHTHNLHVGFRPSGNFLVMHRDGILRK